MGLGVAIAVGVEAGGAAGGASWPQPDTTPSVRSARMVNVTTNLLSRIASFLIAILQHARFGKLKALVTLL